MAIELLDVKSKLRQYIAHNLIFSDDGFTYDDDASLLEAGIVDSLGVMELVLFVGEVLGVKVEDQDVTPDNFDSINKLADYVCSRMACEHAQAR